MWVVTNLLRITDLYRTKTYLKSIAQGHTGGLSNEPPKNRRSKKGKKIKRWNWKEGNSFFFFSRWREFFFVFFFCKCNLTRVMTLTQQWKRVFTSKDVILNYATTKDVTSKDVTLDAFMNYNESTKVLKYQFPASLTWLNFAIVI